MGYNGRVPERAHGKVGHNGRVSTRAHVKVGHNGQVTTRAHDIPAPAPRGAGT